MHATQGVPPAARALLFATAIVWLIAELRQSANRRPEAVVSDLGSRRVVRLTGIAGIAVAIVVSQLASGAAIARGPAAWVGLVVLWCGIGLRLWCFRTLGRYFTFTVQTSEDQPVITSGPYRVIRHPSYAGSLLAVTGIGLFIGNWGSLIALVVLVASGLVYRIRVEDRALLNDLGDNYRTYAATHKRLVPFIW